MNTLYHPLRFTTLTLALSLIAAPSRAASPFAVTPIPLGALVTLNGRTVAVIRLAQRGQSPVACARQAIRRLEAFLAAGGRPIAIQPRPSDEGAAVYAGETLVAIVTSAEAAAQHKSAPDLADRWARNLRAALTLPPLEPLVLRETNSGGQATKGQAGVGDRSSTPTPTPTPARPFIADHPRPKAQGPAPKASPVLELATQELVVPVGETRVVSLKASGPVTVEVPDTETAEVTAGEGQEPSLTVRGVAPGKRSIRVVCGTASATLSVVVMKYAGKIDPKAALVVTGRPCPETVVQESALQAVSAALSLEPGASVTLGRVTGPAAALEPDQTGSVQIPVTIKGPGYLPVERTVSVAATGRGLSPQEPRVLLYSNNPERVTGPASLFLGALERDVATRLLYHHQNMSGRPLSLRVDLVNAGEQPEEVQVIEGGAGPSWDTVMVGERAAVRYLRHQQQDAGMIVTLAPGERRTIMCQRMADKLAVSGLYGLRLLPQPPSTDASEFSVQSHPQIAQIDAERKDPLSAHLRQSADEVGPRSGIRDPQSTAPNVRVEVASEEVAAPGSESGIDREPVADLARRPLSEEIYTDTRLELHSHFSVGGSWAFIPVGKQAIQNQSARKRLDGNYGVLYDIALELENPTEEERTVSLSLSPDAGCAMGVFQIDGALVEAPQVSPPAEAPLASFRLKPHERRTVPIQTIPVGGSNYPISLIVRTDTTRKAAARSGTAEVVR